MVKEPTMQKVSFKTLALMVLLLVSVLTHQYVSWAPAAHADVLWLVDDDPNEPVPEVANAAFGLLADPNEPEPELVVAGQYDDPDEPEPEVIVAGQYDDPDEPEPEVIVAGQYDDPDEPEPEVA
jgi:nitrogen fixation-related uncharacterized protein